MQNTIHPTAIVDPHAELDGEVSVGPYSIIGPEARIGKGCRIGPHVVIEGRTTLGPRNEVFQFASVGARPQDLKYRDEPSELVVGAGNTIRECVTLNRGTAAGLMRTVIGDNNLFMASAHVGHDCVVGNNNIFANSVAIAGHVTVSNNVILGGMVGVHQFVRVGDFVMLGAGAMVALDVPPYCIGQGDRCVLRGINTIGLERAGFASDQIKDIRRAFRLLLSGVGNLQQKIEELPADFREAPHIKTMVDFLAGTKRGVTRAARDTR